MPEGFILPIVIILSLAISTVGISFLQTITNSSVSLNDQYYQQLAKEAAQAGIKTAESCINQGPAYLNNKPQLKPNLDCNGANSGPMYVASSNNWNSGFTVEPPMTVTGVTTVTSEGRVDLLSPNGTTVQSYKKTIKARIGQTTTVVAAKAPAMISGGYTHMCALASVPSFSNMQMYCWGSNYCGQNANNVTSCGTSYQAYPKTVANSAILSNKTFTSISAGNGRATGGVSRLGSHYGTCATAYPTAGGPASAQAYCWGNHPGNSNNLSPVQITGNLTSKSVTQVSTGPLSTCALGYSGSAPAGNQVYCWGQGGYTGNGTNTAYLANNPQLISGGSLAGKIPLMISVGDAFACAVAYPSGGNQANTSVHCWGANDYRQLGTGTSISNSNSPVAVDTTLLAGKTITSLSTGGYEEAVAYYCDPGTGYTSWCWDYYYEHGVACVTAYPTGGSTDNTTLYCWGANSNGELGIGTNAPNSNKPVAVTGLLSGKTVTQVSVGSQVVCAVAHPVGQPTQAQPYCWGYRYGGSLGDGNGSNGIVNSPAAVVTSGWLNNKTVSAIAVSGPDLYGSACVIAYQTAATTDSRLYCWGNNNGGQLGTGNTIGSTIPVPADVSANSDIGPTTVSTTSLPLFY